MSSLSVTTITDGFPADANHPSQLPPSAVSWGAILAGAAAAAALSLILLFLGTGLGLSAASPWANSGIGAKAFGTSTIVWIALTQLLASGLGGYLAGRLRVRWAQTPVDEVYFRDTAHGLLTWAVATLATAALLGSVIGSILQGGVQAGATVASGVTGAGAAAAVSATASGPDHADRNGQPLDYFVDSLFRETAMTPTAPPEAAQDQAATATTDAAATVPPPAPHRGTSRGEVTRIFMHTLKTGALSPEDRSYVGQLVAARTGLPQPQAEERVDAMYAAAQSELQNAETAARAAADEARKVSAKTALWMFVSLLIGAFVASLAATFGGRQRDQL